MKNVEEIKKTINKFLKWKDEANLSKKILVGLLCLISTITFAGCSNKNESVEKTLIENGWYIEASDEDILIKKFYDNIIGIRCFRYDNESTSIEFLDEFLLDGVIVNIKDGSIASNFTHINDNFFKDEAIKLKNFANQELANLNLSYDELLDYMNYKMDNDPNCAGDDSTAIIEIEEDLTPLMSTVKTEYIALTDLSISSPNIKKDGFMQYSYKDIPLLSEDCGDIIIDQGAIYRKVATLLEGFNMGLNNGSQYSEYVIGKYISDKSDFEPYYTSLSKFITNNNSLENVMNKFASLDSVKGNFDTNAKSYNFQITNLTECAKEMQISEEMLGAILAMIDEYAPTVEFTDNSYTCKLNL